MSVTAHLTAIVEGRRPDDDGLLSTCRLEWQGFEAYGEEAILELFRESPLATDDLILVETATAAAWIGSNSALIADLFDGRVGRLWRVGDGSPPQPEPRLSVAFDADLRQARGDVTLRPEDHPELARDRIAELITVGTELSRSQQSMPTYRARAFALRAFSSGPRTAALFAIYLVTSGPVRQSTWGNAAVLLGGPTVVDPLGKLTTMSHF